MGARLLLHNIWRSFSSSVGKSNESVTVCHVCAFSQSASVRKYDLTETEVVQRQTDEFAVPSPYKNPGPRRYGYHIKYKTQDCLPRNDRPVKTLPPYKPVDRWQKKSALFGQNDYIDILGDGTIHPSDLLTGPPWIVGFKGNERERLMRKMEWQGARMRVLYPAEFNRVQKRIRYLTKLYNTKRHMKGKD